LLHVKLLVSRILKWQLDVWDIVLGIATGYGLGSPGINSGGGGARFSALVQTGPGPTQLPMQLVTGLSQG
jgi:hypothetical protein